MFKPKAILVPTDFSHPSNKALGEAIDIASQYKAKIHLIHVIPQDLDYMCSPDYCVEAGSMRQIEEKARPGALQSLQKQLQKFPEAVGLEVIMEIRAGNPADEILKAQIENEIDLIVMAPLGRTGIAQFLLGSVTNNVVRGVRCLVLLVR